MKTPEERLCFLRQGRKPTEWANSLNLPYTTLQGIEAGRGVRAETFRLIARVENASISWLLEGKGHPYLVNHCNDDEAAELLACRFFGGRTSVEYHRFV